MFGDKSDEWFTDVGLYVSTAGRVEPDDLSLSVLALVCRWPCS